MSQSRLHYSGEATEVILPLAEGKAPAAHRSCGLGTPPPSRGPQVTANVTWVGAAAERNISGDAPVSSSRTAAIAPRVLKHKLHLFGKYPFWGLLIDGGHLMLYVLALPRPISSQEVAALPTLL